MKVRKKPVEVEAFQLTRRHFDAALDFASDCRGEYNSGEFAEDSCYLDIVTLEGVMRASENDWIIKGVSGEFYPCKPDIFEKTYEVVK